MGGGRDLGSSRWLCTVTERLGCRWVMASRDESRRGKRRRRRRRRKSVEELRPEERGGRRRENVAEEKGSCSGATRGCAWTAAQRVEVPVWIGLLAAVRSAAQASTNPASPVPRAGGRGSSERARILAARRGGEEGKPREGQGSDRAANRRIEANNRRYSPERRLSLTEVHALALTAL